MNIATEIKFSINDQVRIHLVKAVRNKYQQKKNEKKSLHNSIDSIPTPISDILVLIFC